MRKTWAVFQTWTWFWSWMGSSPLQSIKYRNNFDQIWRLHVTCVCFGGWPTVVGWGDLGADSLIEAGNSISVSNSSFSVRMLLNRFNTHIPSISPSKTFIAQQMLLECQVPIAPPTFAISNFLMGRPTYRPSRDSKYRETNEQTSENAAHIATL